MIDIRLNMHIVGLVTWNDFITGVRYKNNEGKIGKTVEEILYGNANLTF